MHEYAYGFDQQQASRRVIAPAPFAEHAPSSLKQNAREKDIAPSRDLRRAAAQKAEDLRNSAAAVMPEEPTMLERLQCAPQYWYGKGAVAQCLLEASRK